MKIVINFPSDAKMKDIVKVATALSELEDAGYEFETVVGKPAPTFDPHTPTPRTFDARSIEPAEGEADKPDDFDWMSLIDQDVPGASDQDDPSLRRRAQRVSDDEGTDRRSR